MGLRFAFYVSDRFWYHSWNASKDLSVHKPVIEFLLDRFCILLGNGSLHFILETFCNVHNIRLSLSELFFWCFALDPRIVKEDTCALNDTNTTQPKVDTGKAFTN